MSASVAVLLLAWCVGQSRSCPGPTNCMPLEWSPWSSCSVTCGSGQQTRTRNATAETCGGQPCVTSDLMQAQACTIGCCRVDCQAGTWATWSPCSTMCGNGVQTRTRPQQVAAECGGYPCSLSETTSCNPGCCPVDCAVSAWTSWGACTQTCGSSYRQRSRSVTTAASCGGACGALSDTETCQGPCCPVNCQWSAWGGWTACSAGCGSTSSGTTSRTRSIATVSSCGGTCPGTASENASCTPSPVQCATIAPTPTSRPPTINTTTTTTTTTTVISTSTSSTAANTNTTVTTHPSLSSTTSTSTSASASVSTVGTTTSFTTTSPTPTTLTNDLSTPTVTVTGNGETVDLSTILPPKQTSPGVDLTVHNVHLHVGAAGGDAQLRGLGVDGLGVVSSQDSNSNFVRSGFSIELRFAERVALTRLVLGAWDAGDVGHIAFDDGTDQRTRAAGAVQIDRADLSLAAFTRAGFTHYFIIADFPAQFSVKSFEFTSTSVTTVTSSSSVATTTNSSATTTTTNTSSDVDQVTDSAPALDIALIAGIAGGAGGLLLILIVVIVVVVVVRRRRRNDRPTMDKDEQMSSRSSAMVEFTSARESTSMRSEYGAAPPQEMSGIYGAGPTEKPAMYGTGPAEKMAMYGAGPVANSGVYAAGPQHMYAPAPTPAAPPRANYGAAPSMQMHSSASLPRANYGAAPPTATAMYGAAPPVHQQYGAGPPAAAGGNYASSPPIANANVAYNTFTTLEIGPK